jgi:hypothetical protein
MILVCNRKDGGDRRAAAEGFRTLDDLMMKRMMMMTIFYGGTGTDCTGTNGWRTATRRGRWGEDRRDDGNNHTNTNNSNNTSRNTNNDRTTVKMTPGARCDTVRSVHWQKKKDERWVATEGSKMRTTDKSNRWTRMMNDGCVTLVETSDGHGDDLHQEGRMEDDEDGGTPMLSATGTLDRKTGQATPMRQSATGTLDRKTDQAPTMTCFQPSTPTHEKRPTTNDKECRGHEEDTKDGCSRMTRMSIAARQGKLLDDDRQVDSMVL